MRVAVIGAGVVGLATSHHLLRLGAEVTCYEYGAPMGERSVGESRIFRLAHLYPDLVALAVHSRQIFRAWEEELSQTLIGNSGLIISGEDLELWANSMADAGAAFDLRNGTRDTLRLPTSKPPRVALFDPEGGVLHADRVGAFLLSQVSPHVRLEPVHRLENTLSGVTVWSTGETAHFDAAVICAGAGTAALASQVEVYTPTALAHHYRFAFPLRSPAPDLPCWITRSTKGLSTYQHLSAEGQWAVGGHVDPSQTAWEVGPQRAEAASRDAVLRYVRDELDMVTPEVIGIIRCSTMPDIGDGYNVQRSGNTLVAYGENLFKLAPVLGLQLAEAVINSSTPKATGFFSS